MNYSVSSSGSSIGGKSSNSIVSVIVGLGVVFWIELNLFSCSDSSWFSSGSGTVRPCYPVPEAKYLIYFRFENS